MSKLIGLPMAQGPQAQPWETDDEAEEYIADPRKFLLEKCKDFQDNIELFHNTVMVATYYLPSYHTLSTGHKLYRSDKTLDEALWQGKVGLVVAKGRMAFVDDEYRKFSGQNVDIGDWVYYDIHDGRQLTINRVHCRRLKDVEVMGRVKVPYLVY